MARPERNNVDYFPKWNPTKKLLLKLDSDFIDRKESFKCFRGSCSAFISRNDVRTYLLDKYSNECVLCNSTENLQIDHILSVHKHFLFNMFYECNIESNLQVLCRTCNTSKLP